MCLLPALSGSRVQGVVNTWCFTTSLPCRYLSSYNPTTWLLLNYRTPRPCAYHYGTGDPFSMQYRVIQGFCQKPRNFVRLFKENRILRLSSTVIGRGRLQSRLWPEWSYQGTHPGIQVASFLILTNRVLSTWLYYSRTGIANQFWTTLENALAALNTQELF